MWADQAIYTSMIRDGHSGYHIVAHSPGTTSDELRAISTWSPSEGSLQLDALNRCGLSFYPLPGGRFCLSRTCAGSPEYSGRGNLQIYTSVLILGPDTLARVQNHPVTLYRAVLALGAMLFQAEPQTVLPRLRLPSMYRNLEPRDWLERARRASVPGLPALIDRMAGEQSGVFAFHGNRIDLVEVLIGTLPPSLRLKTSFTASLVPSSVRPARIALSSSSASNEAKYPSMRFGP